MWSDVHVLSGTLLGNSGAGSWGFGLGPDSMRFYKDIRIVGVQASLIVRDANGSIEANADIYIQQPTNKGNSFGSFGGGNFYAFTLHDGANLTNVVEIDVPANVSVTIVGSCYFQAVSGSPTQGSCYVDILYKVKSFL